MLYLHWIYGFVSSITGVFVQIYIYQLFHDVRINVLAQAILFTGIVVGFSVLGYLFSLLRANLKWGYLYAFIVLAGSFIFLHGDIGRAQALWFMFCYGIGLGLYWLTLHTFELTETKNEERDLYSSLLSAGDQVISLLGPVVATITFYLSTNMGWGSYTLLFIISPIIYLLGLPLFRYIRAYHPQPIEWNDVIHFLQDRKNRFSHLYFFVRSANYGFSKVAFPLAAVIFLGTEMSVGLFNSFFAVLSVFSLVYLSRFRHTENRLVFLFVITTLQIIIALILAGTFSFWMFILFSLASIILSPLARVSQHVIDLETMETLGRRDTDFYATMVLRDFALWVWRIVSLGVLLIILLIIPDTVTAVRVIFVGIALSCLATYAGARLMFYGRKIGSF